jgi:superfamily II DNA or RNA helicase
MPKQWFEQFGMVIGDEAHTFQAKSLSSIMEKLTDCPYRFGTTGTLDGTLTHRLVLEGLFGTVYQVTTTKALMDDDKLAKLDIKALVLQYSDDECKAMKGKTYAEEIDFIVGHTKRNNFIKNLALTQTGNTLVLFNRVDKHGKPLFKLIRDAADENRKVFYVSGETDVVDREAIRSITEKEKNAIIVASLGTFSTGINIKNLHNIIFASPSKSQIKVLQSIGRGLRKSDDGRDCTLYDICDDLHWKTVKNYTLVHAGIRIQIYSKEKFNYKIHEVKLTK